MYMTGIFYHWLKKHMFITTIWLCTMAAVAEHGGWNADG
jgi:hypothetical protein